MALAVSSVRQTKADRASHSAPSQPGRTRRPWLSVPEAVSRRAGLARGGAITGVTSAAVVWMLAAIGSTIGIGRPAEGLLLALLVVVILIGVRLLESAFKRLRGGYDAPEEVDAPSD